jgi:endonuclease/exonuclease/phosphatase family metal-dependent hydrolase
MKNRIYQTVTGTLFLLSFYIGSPLHLRAEDSTLRVMSYNIHRGGVVFLKQPLSQTANAILLAKADIVGIQETRSPRGDTLEDLAKLLGWNYDEGSCIVTRYEIVEHFKGGKDYKGGIKVKLASDKHAYIFNLHLPSHPYQPYQLLGIRPKWHKHTNNITFIKTEAETIEWAKKARGAEIRKLLRQIKSIPDKEAPVFVVGDFNEPSHLDWTEAAARAGRHPIKVEYPTSTEMAKAGFSDSYRTIFPDEMKNPGITWSPAYKVGDPRTHHDRIRFRLLQRQRLGSERCKDPRRKRRECRSCDKPLSLRSSGGGGVF